MHDTESVWTLGKYLEVHNFFPSTTHQVIQCPGLQEPLDPMQSNRFVFHMHVHRLYRAGSGHGIGQLQGVKDRKESKRSKRKEKSHFEGQKVPY